MQFYMSFLCTCGQRSALTIRCCIVLYLVESIGCQPYTSQSISKDSYYKNGNIMCIKCPAGNYVKKDCVKSNTQGICRMCNPGVTYSEHQTGLNRCLTCTQCRADQEEISPCNITKNTICQCKKGTYCPMNSICKQCLPCISSCPDGKVVQQTWDALSDIVCVNVTTRQTVRTWIIPIFSAIIIIGCPAMYFCYDVKCRHSREEANNSKPKIIEAETKNYIVPPEIWPIPTDRKLLLFGIGVLLFCLSLKAFPASYTSSISFSSATCRACSDVRKSLQLWSSVV